MSIAYIGIGGNLGDPHSTIQSAIAELAEHPHIQQVLCSPLFKTAAIGMVGPDFINGVLQITTSASPEALLMILQSMEKKAGRAAHTHYHPRPLDLDILLYDALQIHTSQLTIPHPRMHERAFVLYPLYALAPDLILPQGNWNDLLHQCSQQIIEKI